MEIKAKCSVEIDVVKVVEDLLTTKQKKDLVYDVVGGYLDAKEIMEIAKSTCDIPDLLAQFDEEDIIEYLKEQGYKVSE